jgi:hypothetical protein
MSDCESSEKRGHDDGSQKRRAIRPLHCRIVYGEKLVYLQKWDLDSAILLEHWFAVLLMLIADGFDGVGGLGKVILNKRATTAAEKASRQKESP